MEEKSSLKVYRKYKGKIKEGIYYNDEKSRVIFRIRSNTLKLKDRERHVGGEVRCELCGSEKEDLEHFVLECWKLQKERNGMIIAQRPIEEDKEKVLGMIMFNEECTETLYKMWKKREALLRGTS